MQSGSIKYNEVHLLFFAMKTESIMFSLLSLFFGFNGAYSVNETRWICALCQMNGCKEMVVRFNIRTSWSLMGWD